MQNNDLSFLEAPGEMAALMRSKNWAEMSVGSAHNWPQSLKTTISIILNSKFPMFLFWGRDLICFYNDAYRPSLGENGKHPSILGMNSKESWPEIYDFVSTWTNKVFETGEAVMFYDNLVPFYRNGRLEDIYWTFSYSAVKDESGEIVGVLTTCMETTQQVMAKRALEESKAELEFTIEAAELGTFDYNPNTNLFTANNRLKSWLGLKENGEILLERGLNAVREQDRKRVAQAIKDAVDPVKKAKFDLEFALIQPNTNREIIVYSKGKAEFPDENKTAVRFTGTLQDITEQRKFTEELEQQIKIRTDKLNKANRELKEKNLKLERSNEELRSFSYISSHDLQEPLRKIQTFASRLLEKEYDVLSDRGKDYFDRMQRSANRMQNLIQDLLSYSKVNNQKHKKKKTELRELVNEVANNLEEEFAAKNARVVIENSISIKIIPFQFYQLFYNLFTNSLKFGKSDTPVVISINAYNVNSSTVNDEFFDNEKSYCCIEVADNGIGFEPKQGKLIFELFQRLHGRNEYEGTGIGLAIVKKIVENHGGKITASGKSGKGAKFTIYIPQ